MERDSGPNGNVYLVSAARTPIGKFGGALAAVPAVDLGATAIRAAVDRSGAAGGRPHRRGLHGPRSCRLARARRPPARRS